MKKKIALLVLLVSFCVLSAQGEKFLKSKVVYKGTEIPIVGATAEIKKLSLVTKTDNNGVFFFKKELPEGKHVISVIKKGFIFKEKLVEKKKGEEIDLVEIEIALLKNNLIIYKGREVPIAEATVEIKELGLVAKTDNNGVFRFKKKLPEGEHVISVMKEGVVFEKKLIKKIKGVKINLIEIEIALTKKEKEKRIKIREKLIEEHRRRLCNRGGTRGAVNLEPTRERAKIEEKIITENQVKYATILGVDVKEIIHKKLYEFIDAWLGTPYLIDGEAKAGIDCSSFTQRLFVYSYGNDMYVERTAQKQFDSEQTELFKDKKYLREGDLFFFGKDSFNITHVGVYLHNNKFVHSTARKVEGPSGVKISDLSDPFWSRSYFSSGRRLKE